MDQQKIIFETSPGFIILCIIFGIGYGLLLYKTKHPWPKGVNNLLFALRVALVFFLSFLLLGPIIRQVKNFFDKPLYVILTDNSASVKEATDSIRLKTIQQEFIGLKHSLEEKGYEVQLSDLDGELTNNNLVYRKTTSDIQSALKKVANLYEGRNLSGVVFLSDGIYNSGLSPLYSAYNFPVHTVGVGDTTERTDLAIRNIAYNKIAYQGNRFPVRVEVLAKGLSRQDITVSLISRGKVLDKQTKNAGNDALIPFDFQPLAEEQGIQKLDVQVDVRPEEFNVRNNRASVFVEVVEGKKKILLVASAPHPDIKALRSVVEKNANYEFILHVPGTIDQPASALQPDKIDLAIFYQCPDLRGKTRELFHQFATSKTSLFLIIGRQSDLSDIVQQNMPLKFESIPRDFDEVLPVVNSTFASFSVASEANSQIANYPPVSVHFGKIQLPLSATPVLFQRVGNVSTDKPLMAVDAGNTRKIGIMLGEGFWRWRLFEFDRTNNSEAFDELFGKLIQFLSTSDEKKKFRSYPVKQEFSTVEPVVFESQVYNDIFEPVYGNSINIGLADERNKKTQYSYVISPGNARYQVGGLQEGVYRYSAKTVINGKTEEVSGQFAIVEQLAELQNLTADFDLLRKLAGNTGGRFYNSAAIKTMQDKLTSIEAKSIIRSEETYDSLINIKWIFGILLTLITVEWFLRKYYGSY